MQYYERIPFNDGYILGSFGVPTILMLTGPTKETMLKRIFEVQHCGPDDHNIDIISEEMMDKVFEVVKGMVNGFIPISN
jgi:predicted small metal-binding protein